jgi:hypothetical protein
MRLLNIGAGPKGLRVPPQYEGWDVVRLDIEPRHEPDLLMDAMDLITLEPGQYDAAYASHLLEHLYPMQVEQFMIGVRHVLAPDGFVEFHVPNALRACKAAVEAGRLDAFCYTSSAGDVTAWDALYGHRRFLMQYGGAMAHHNAFSTQSLTDLLFHYGFVRVYLKDALWQTGAIGCLSDIPAETKRRMGIGKATGQYRPVHSDDGGADVATVRQLRQVAEPSFQPPDAAGGDGHQAAEGAAGRRGADLSRGEDARRRLRLPVVHRPGRGIPAGDA